ncbi:MAG: GAF domain-containing protein, partial [Chloroflexota bacterium]
MVVQVQEPKQDSREIWSNALAAAAGVARQAASSEEDLVRAVTKELRRLKLRGGVALLQPDGTLIVRGLTLSTTVERQLKRLTGQSLEGYRFDPQQVDAYRQALQDRQAVFTSDRSRVIGQMIPEQFRPLLPRIIQLLGDHPVIVAPLVLDDQLLGAMNVSAPWL